MVKLTIKLILVLVFTLICGTSISVAKKDAPVSLEQASEFARTQSKGKVLSAKTTLVDGEKAHRIKVITTSGRVKVFQIPVSVNKRNVTNHNNNRTLQLKPRRPSKLSTRQTNNPYSAPNIRTKPAIQGPKQK